MEYLDYDVLSLEAWGLPKKEHAVKKIVYIANLEHLGFRGK